MNRALVLAGVASLAFGMGVILFYVMVALWVPSAVPYFAPYLPQLAGVPLIVGMVLLNLGRTRWA